MDDKNVHQNIKRLAKSCKRLSGEKCLIFYNRVINDAVKKLNNRVGNTASVTAMNGFAEGQAF